MKDVRLLHGHSAKCTYLAYREDNPGSPWYFRPDRPHESRQHNRTFVEAICNDVSCKGRVRIATNWIEDQVPSFIDDFPGGT